MKRSHAVWFVGVWVMVLAGAVQGSLVTVPFETEVWITYEGGSAGASTDLGVGSRTSPGPVLLQGMPHTPPTSVSLGILPAGTGIDLWLLTQWGDRQYEAYSSDLEGGDVPFAAIEVFRDRNGDLGFGAIQVLGACDWRLHLDDAASSDDDDNDVVLRIHSGRPPVEPPHPVPDGGGTAVLLLSAVGLLAMRRR